MPKLTDKFNWEHGEYSTFNAFLAGIECEVESVRGLEGNVDSFIATNDGSLRNHGIEYISLPMTRDNLIPEFKKLHASMQHYNRDEAFSPRTSTHVHINCRTLTTEQLKNLMLFYALFEEVFFSMVDADRRHNIHCVPLTETYLPINYRKDIIAVVKNWHKYTAFNMLPIIKQGTVEFRHLQGTRDAGLLDEWLTCLQNLWEICQAETITAQNIVDERQIRQWFRDIFAHSPRVMALEPAVPHMIRNSLLDVKFALI